MTKQRKSNKGWIFGSVLGAIAGAAYALWKTPMSGREARSKLSPGSSGHGQPMASGGRVSDKFMHVVEHRLAPIVGVQLGKTANGDAETVAVTKTVYTAGATPSEPTTVATQPDSIREQRWAWGSPAPEVNVVNDPKFQAAETAQLESDVADNSTREAADTSQVDANLSESAPSSEGNPVVAPSSNATPAFGGQTIRERRFAWGDPAPETTTAPAATELNAVPSAAGVMPEQTPAGSSLTSSMSSGDVTTTTGTADIQPDRTPSGSSLTTPSPEQRVVATSATDAVGTTGTETSSGSTNIDDTTIISSAGHATGKMNAFPKLGGLEHES